MRSNLVVDEIYLSMHAWIKYSRMWMSMKSSWLWITSSRVIAFVCFASDFFIRLLCIWLFCIWLFCIYCLASDCFASDCFTSDFFASAVWIRLFCIRLFCIRLFCIQIFLRPTVLHPAVLHPTVLNLSVLPPTVLHPSALIQKSMIFHSFRPEVAYSIAVEHSTDLQCRCPPLRIISLKLR
jgi:hypothetical protein